MEDHLQGKIVVASPPGFTMIRTVVSGDMVNDLAEALQTIGLPERVSSEHSIAARQIRAVFDAVLDALCPRAKKDLPAAETNREILFNNGGFKALRVVQQNTTDSCVIAGPRQSLLSDQTGSTALSKCHDLAIVELGKKRAKKQQYILVPTPTEGHIMYIHEYVMKYNALFDSGLPNFSNSTISSSDPELSVHSHR